MSAPDTPNVCPTCDDTGLVAPLGGRGSDGPDPCPHCTPAAGSPSPHPDPNEFMPRMQAAIDDPVNAAVRDVLTAARDEVYHAWRVCDAAVFEANKAEQSTRQQCVMWMQEARAIAAERDALRAGSPSPDVAALAEED